MGFFIPHIIFWIAVEIIFDPGVIVVQVGEAPAVVYDKNTKKLIIPSYEQTKHIIKCIERNDSRCLRSN